MREASWVCKMRCLAVRVIAKPRSCVLCQTVQIKLLQFVDHGLIGAFPMERCCHLLEHQEDANVQVTISKVNKYSFETILNNLLFKHSEGTI